MTSVSLTELCSERESGGSPHCPRGSSSGLLVLLPTRDPTQLFSKLRGRDVTVQKAVESFLTLFSSALVIDRVPPAR